MTKTIIELKNEFCNNCSMPIEACSNCFVNEFVYYVRKTNENYYCQDGSCIKHPIEDEMFPKDCSLKKYREEKNERRI